MENRKEEQQGERRGWMTVPAFGEWDMKNGAVPDYSMDFSKIREMRKQNKRELSRASLGGDDDLLAQQQKAARQPQAQVQPTKADFAPPPPTTTAGRSMPPTTTHPREGRSSLAISSAVSEPDEL